MSDRIIDRLAKLLELKESSNEHEAQLAAQRAAELMAKYQLSEADVAATRGVRLEPTTESGRIDDVDGAKPSRVEQWHKQLGMAVAEANGARMWMQGKGREQIFRVIGPPDAVSTTRYLYLALEKEIAKLARQAMREHMETQNAWRRAYCLGVVARIRDRLREGRKVVMQTATSTALVRVDAQALKVKEEFEKLTLRSAKVGRLQRPDAGTYGYRDGDRVDVGAAGRARIGEGNKKLGS